MPGLPLPSGDGAVSVATYGASPSASPAANTAAFQSAANAQRPILVPDETYQLADRVILRNNSQFYARGRARLLMTAASEKPIFYADQLDYFRVSNLELRGNTAWTGAGNGANDRGAIVVYRTADFDVDGNWFEDWTGSGVAMGQSGGSYLQSGRIAGNRFRKGNVDASFDPWVTGESGGDTYGLSDNAAVQMYTGCQGVRIHDNTIEGRWGIGIMAQDISGLYSTRIHGLDIRNNTIRDAEIYGMMFYAAIMNIILTVEDDGTGQCLLTIGRRSATAPWVAVEAPHQVEDGAWVTAYQAGAANGLYQAQVISDTQLVLRGSVYAPTTTVTTFAIDGYPSITASILAAADQNGGRCQGNHIDGVVGRRYGTVGDPGVTARYYGMGVYLVASGGLDFFDQTLERCNQLTDGTSLPPAALCISQPVGRVRVRGGRINNTHRQAIGIAKNKVLASPLIISEMEIEGGQSDLAINAMDAGNTTLRNIYIRPGQNGAGGGVWFRNVGQAPTTLTPDVTLDGVHLDRPRSPSQTTGIYLQHLRDYVVRRCRVRNGKKSSETFNAFRITDCAEGLVHGNTFDNGANTVSQVGVISAVTDTQFEHNRFRWAGASGVVVSIGGLCTGSFFARSNRLFSLFAGAAGYGLVQHFRSAPTDATGMIVETQGVDPTLGGAGAARQVGDVVVNRDPATMDAIKEWTKVTAGAVTSGWTARAP